MQQLNSKVQQKLENNIRIEMFEFHIFKVRSTEINIISDWNRFFNWIVFILRLFEMNEWILLIELMKKHMQKIWFFEMKVDARHYTYTLFSWQVYSGKPMLSIEMELQEKNKSLRLNAKR